MDRSIKVQSDRNLTFHTAYQQLADVAQADSPSAFLRLILHRRDE